MFRCRVFVYIEITDALEPVSYTHLVTDPIAEYRCFLVLFGSTYGFSQHGGQAVAVEYVITQYKADGIISDCLLYTSISYCVRGM